MAVLIGAARAQADPLSEVYFVRAAGALDTHCAGPWHVCISCAATWPCEPALAAAFMLELHADERGEPRNGPLSTTTCGSG